MPLTGTEKTSEYRREKEGGGKKEGKRSRRKGNALFVFLAEGDSTALVFSC